ncbi:DUF5626 family protein [Geomicrobium sp. JCM 19038]|uniref:DUF5626 family protein n=1 Tax=Geomicrobium sp. JCM 19038 TaxID=1460635 RepID=UPI00045F13A5|nr:DUF5626 family protein [Geomicrobium sp. JCM 19038]GAK06484.1 hypothetical protein JCM19038_180 [Geomicrobium sp. JCM 19038]
MQWNKGTLGWKIFLPIGVLAVVVIVSAMIVSSHSEAHVYLDEEQQEDGQSSILGIEQISSSNPQMDTYRAYRNVGTYQVEYYVDVSTEDHVIVDAYDLSFRVIGGTFNGVPEVQHNDERATFNESLTASGGISSYMITLFVDIEDDRLVVTY